ncbi:hypothetical protein [Paraburkholderia sacchari]|uniref:hypothetical protein n=1 Tax=Paraburkholderia sacchari TaxID=159450 RepID=UPI0005443CBF|nr:hypothetical protein [Paraburkholderia sacchari]NLP62238.1 hypothetical protein [Paraburkholderia sacchari]
MQVEFAFAAPSAAAVATHQTWFVRSVEAGTSAISIIAAKQGVMTYDARKADRKVRGASVAANVTGSC